MGKPVNGKPLSILTLCQNGELGEVKHLSTQRKRKKSRLNVGNILLVAASEKGIVQTYFIFSFLSINGGCKTIMF